MRKEHGSLDDDACGAFTCGYDYCSALVKAVHIAPTHSTDRHVYKMWTT